MGQVPQYLIIGNGRVARHFCIIFPFSVFPFPIGIVVFP